MQLPTRVFIAADTHAEARKLVQTFKQSPGFAVAGFGLADRLIQVRDGVDVILIHSSELGRIPARSQATVPILYLVQGETRTLRLDRASAVLRQDASPRKSGQRLRRWPPVFMSSLFPPPHSATTARTSRSRKH